MKEDFIVSEETVGLVGLKIVDNGDTVILRDINTIDGEECEGEFVVMKSDIPKLIEGLQRFLD